MNFIRCILFNIVFYGVTAIFCILFIPLFLLPIGLFWAFLNIYFKSVHLIEKYVLGLDFEIRGKENIPKDGSFLIAAKHQSAYETMKFPILFDKPAIIMKKELQYIPIWGWIAKRAGMIAIDRENRETAIKSIIDGANRVKEEGRPIVIFPQGTRVAVGESSTKKRYKGGILKMQQATGLPIIPMAINSGLFWGRNAFIKKPGKVIMEFLPAIDAESEDVMKKLEDVLETHSNKLVEEELERRKATK